MTTLREAAQAAPKSADLPDYVSKALRRAWQLGQTYWQQADSESYAANRRSGTTQAIFNDLLEAVRTAIAAQPAPSEPKVTVTTNQAGDAVAVTLTDDDNRVLRVLWERAAQPAPDAVPFAYLCVVKTDAGPTKFFTAPSDPRGFPVYLGAAPIAQQAAPAQAELESLRRDADRYRWLRRTTNWASSNGERVDVRNNPKLWDEAIDAAMKESK
jgi:hypothetical protein